MTVPPISQPAQPPGPKPAKSRLRQDGRDMFWSMMPLIVGCIVLAGLLGMCSFAPNGPGEGAPPPYDAPAALQSDADTLGIPIRLPELPQGWQANSGGRASIEGGRTEPDGTVVRALTSRVGYLAPTGMFISLTQSNADEEKLVQSIETSLVPTGTQDVAGVNWIVYEGSEDVRPVWTTTLSGPTGPVRLALTGAAGTAEYRTLAEATQTQPPLPVG